MKNLFYCYLVSALIGVASIQSMTATRTGSAAPAHTSQVKRVFSPSLLVQAPANGYGLVGGLPETVTLQPQGLVIRDDVGIVITEVSFRATDGSDTPVHFGVGLPGTAGFEQKLDGYTMADGSYSPAGFTGLAIRGDEAAGLAFAIQAVNQGGAQGVPGFLSITGYTYR